MALGTVVCLLSAGVAVTVALTSPALRNGGHQTAVAASGRRVVPLQIRSLRRRLSRGAEQVPILMYHVINSPPTNARFPGLYVTPRQFSAQMEALARAGFTGVTLNQVEANWKQGAPLPAGHPVVISFDNGYRTQFTRAFSLLRKLGWPAVENLQLEGLPPSQGGLTPREIQALVRAGWELDTQGFTHADLIRLDPQRLLHEVGAARVAIRRRYHTPADWFAYPSGHYDATVITAVKAAGYIGATTVVAGWADPRDDPYTLPRFRILAGTTPQGLLAQLADGRHTADPPSSYL